MQIFFASALRFTFTIHYIKEKLNLYCKWTTLRVITECTTKSEGVRKKRKKSGLLPNGGGRGVSEGSKKQTSIL